MIWCCHLIKNFSLTFYSICSIISCKPLDFFFQEKKIQQRKNQANLKVAINKYQQKICCAQKKKAQIHFKISCDPTRTRSENTDLMSLMIRGIIWYFQCMYNPSWIIWNPLIIDMDPTTMWQCEHTLGVLKSCSDLATTEVLEQVW